MSNNIKETITVDRVGKYGPSVNGIWYSLGPKSGLTSQNFEKGKTYQVLIWTSASGKKYINQIVGENVTLENNQVEPVKEKPGDDKILKVFKQEKKEVDWDKIAAGKVSCAIITSLNQSPWIGMYALNKEDALKLIKEVAEEQIKWVFEHQRG